MNVIERFLKYVTFETTSDEDSETCPSTACQLALADYLAEELRGIGVADAARDELGYVYGHIPASKGMENEPVIGLIAHMDTSPDVSGKNVLAKIIKYDGTNAGMLDDSHIGHELIVTDNTTLLGADDKAGVAEIIAACDRIVSDPSLRHGKICIGFTPDEEIGRGADHFDLERFGADFAYTVDGGELGEIEYENFNAAAVKIMIHGVNTHPGSAKNKMRNAALYATEIVSMLPPAETPAHTEGREGFYHVSGITADETTAQITMIVRDHCRETFEQRKSFVSAIVRFMNDKYGCGTVELDMSDSYYNMKEIIDEHLDIVERAKAAMAAAGVESIIVPIRGGTDGARLSFDGLPCPNLSTGGLNFHSIYEAIPTESLVKMTDVLVNLTCH